ncbi:MAG: hypothetical protein J1F64_10100 [Oscillospiraceae bacterium]|nr:hypothetical protein [Oscillospiraceae bacterium]
MKDIRKNSIVSELSCLIFHQTSLIHSRRKHGWYKDFVLENNRKPGKSKSEGRLYRWRRRQIQAIENNKLNEVQQRMLEEIHY